MGMSSKTGTSMDAADDMLRTIERFQQAPSRTTLPPHGLAIDFPQRSPLGARALKLTARKDSKTLSVMCEPEAVHGRLAEIGDKTGENLRHIGLVLVNYVLHDVAVADRPEFLAGLVRSCPHAVIMVADYTMLDMDQAEAARLFTADLERNRMEEKSFDVYMEEHLQFTYESLYQLLRGGVRAVRGHRLPAGRALVAGSHSELLWTPDTANDWAEEAFDPTIPPMPRSRRVEHLETVGIST